MKPLPENLQPPEGCVILGYGGTFEVPEGGFYGRARLSFHWGAACLHTAHKEIFIYAAPIGSEVVRLNDPKWHLEDHDYTGELPVKGFSAERTAEKLRIVREHLATLSSEERQHLLNLAINGTTNPSQVNSSVTVEEYEVLIWSLINEMHRYLPVLEWLEGSYYWQHATKNLEIATANGYRHALVTAQSRLEGK